MMRALTPDLLLRLWQREADLTAEADLIRTQAECYRHRYCRTLTSAMADSMEAACRVVDRADAFSVTMARINEAGDYDMVCEAERLQHMRRYPYQYPPAELLEVCERIGVTAEWCERRGKKAAVEPTVVRRAA